MKSKHRCLKITIVGDSDDDIRAKLHEVHKMITSYMLCRGVAARSSTDTPFCFSIQDCDKDGNLVFNKGPGQHDSTP